MADTPGGFIWYELMTTDVDAAARFYGAVVGWKIADGAASGAGGRNDYRMIACSDGGMAGGVLPLTKDMLSHGASPTWLGYLHVSDVDAATRAIVADGGAVHLPKLSLPVGDLAMVSDPMGTAFYVMRPVPPPNAPVAASPVFDPKAAQHVRWNELASPDLARAKAFYARHFHFEFNDVMPMGPMGDYCFIDHDGVRLGAIMQQPPEGAPPTWLFYFGVPSIAEAGRAIETGGGRILNGPHQVPGGDWILTAVDPQGAPFGCVGPQGR